MIRLRRRGGELREVFARVSNHEAVGCVIMAQPENALARPPDFAFAHPRYGITTVIPRACGVSSTPRPLDSITTALGILDRPLEPVIGRRAAPTRWRTMTAGIQFSNSNVVRRRSSAISPRIHASFTLNVLPPRYQRAQGMPGARCARSLVCNV